jgi:redox-sensitive bicupin YhaK (pirin superfamily)
MIKNITKIIRDVEHHWVGDGFPVRTLISYDSQGAGISPFLLLDHAGPADFAPADKPRGVGQHPHRGFETVTIVYEGEVEHRDNAGNSGKIGPGDVQWMTAARGILHEEMHGREFTQRGGKLEAVQLWVNLPAKDKMSAPGYQGISSDMIPEISLDNDAGKIRIISGTFKDVAGPARTFTPVNLWDIRLNKSKLLNLDLEDGYTTAVLVLKGTVMVNGKESISTGELVLFERDGNEISFEATDDATLLLMNGEPIDEPIAGYGPFVMNTQEEIKQAITDFNAGRF